MGCASLYMSADVTTHTTNMMSVTGKNTQRACSKGMQFSCHGLNVTTKSVPTHLVPDAQTTQTAEHCSPHTDVAVGHPAATSVQPTSEGIVMAKVGLITAPDCAKFLPGACHARFQIRRPEHRMQQHSPVTCATSGAMSALEHKAAAACLGVRADTLDLLPPACF